MARLICLLLLVTISSCDTENPIEELPAPQVTISRVTPNPAKAGDTLRIFGGPFDSLYWDNKIWIGTTRIFAEGGNDTVLFSRLHFEPSSGLVSVRTSVASADGPILTIIPPGDSLVALQWYAGPPITDTSSWAIGWGCDNAYHKWTFTRSGDTVTLVQSFCYGDDSSVRKTIKFRHTGDNRLPGYISGEWYERPFPGSWREDLRGYIAIEQWSIPGTISGRVSTYFSTQWGEWVDFNFHCTIN